MNILMVAPHYPFFDRASGDLRFAKIIEALAERNRIWFCPLFERKHRGYIGDEENARYRKYLEDLGVHIEEGGPRKVLKEVTVDVVFFEFFFVALDWIRDVRILRPKARVVVDSVDVHFQRLFAKAKVTGDADDYERAKETKKQEIAVYRQADVVVAVTVDDGNLVVKETGDVAVPIVPNIHEMHDPGLVKPDGPVLAFVGSFAHEPNVDAVLYFAREVLPNIVSEIPGVVFNIIGNAPPPEVEALAGESIKVLGYVPATLPYLQKAKVSIAPLRYGAGMKGKIGEAMAAGLPVVTTSIGVEGFGLTDGEDVLVGDTPEEFARHVIQLLTDEDLWQKIRMGGWMLIKERYSDKVVKRKVVELFEELEGISPKKAPLLERLYGRLRMSFEERVLWRLNRA